MVTLSGILACATSRYSFTSLATVMALWLPERNTSMAILRWLLKLCCRESSTNPSLIDAISARVTREPLSLLTITILAKSSALYPCPSVRISTSPPAVLMAPADKSRDESLMALATCAKLRLYSSRVCSLISIASSKSRTPDNVTCDTLGRFSRSLRVCVASARSVLSDWLPAMMTLITSRLLSER